jgi:hypothetical protein
MMTCRLDSILINFVLLFVHCQLQWCGLQMVGFTMQHQQDLQCSGICITIYGLLLWTFVLEEDFWKRRASLIYRLENDLLISVSQLLLCSSWTIHEATSSFRTQLGLRDFTVKFRAFQPGCRERRLSQQAKIKLVLKYISESANSQWSRRVMSARESNAWAFLTKCGTWWKRCNFWL